MTIDSEHENECKIDYCYKKLIRLRRILKVSKVV